MHSNLHGIFEHVNFSNEFTFLLYVNHTPENYAPHWHPAIEIIMPIRNSYEVKTGGRKYCLNEQDIIIIPSGELHELCAPKTGSRLILLIEHSFITDLKGMPSILPLLREPRILSGTNPEDLAICFEATKLLYSMMDEYSSASPLWEVAIYAKLIQLFLLIGRKHFNSNLIFTDSKQNKQKEYIEKFSLIFEYIHTNYMKNISLDDIARIAGFSKFHFSRLFKQFTHMSFYDYLSKERIQAAEILLLDQSLPITEVASQSGFSSIATFNRVFRKYKKCTPTEFRTLYQNK